MENEFQLKVKVLSPDASDILHLKEELSLSVGGESEIELTTEKSSTLEGSRGSAEITIQVIQLAFGAVQTAAAIAVLLSEYKKRKPKASIHVVGGDSSKSVEVKTSTSPNKLEKKLIAFSKI